MAGYRASRLSCSPNVTHGKAPGPALAATLGIGLAATTALIPIGLRLNAPPAITMLGGLAVFGFVFALNSSVHSYLVLAYSEADRVSQSVGFYYMANACGRLLGTLLSGVLYQRAGVAASLWGAVVLAAAAGCGALFLPPVTASNSVLGRRERRRLGSKSLRHPMRRAPGNPGSAHPSISDRRRQGERRQEPGPQWTHRKIRRVHPP